MNLINADSSERVETKHNDGTVFIGSRQWVQNTTGANFPQADVAQAREIIGAAYIAGDLNLWGVVLEWALAKGYNHYEANLLAGHLWCEIL